MGISAEQLEAIKLTAEVLKKEAEARSILIAHRDKHLSQFMEINAKGAVAILTTIFVVFVGASKLDGLVLPPCAWVVVGILIGCAMGMLAVAVGKFSKFHTDRIRCLQVRLGKNALAVQTYDYEVIPPTSGPNRLVFFGLLILAVVAVAVFIGQAAMVALEKSKKARTATETQCSPTSSQADLQNSESPVSTRDRQSAAQQSASGTQNEPAAPAPPPTPESGATPAVQQGH